MNDLLQAILSGGASGAVVSGLWKYLSDRQLQDRDTSAVRRQIRAAAHALATRVILARQFGFTNVSAMVTALSYLQERPD